MIKKIGFMFTFLYLFLTINVYSMGIKDKPEAQLSSTQHDFGLIIPFYGKVETEFKLTNIGTAKLEIINLSTSCTCTTITSDKMELVPGEQATLHVVFDPLAHRGVTGNIRRNVYIETNDRKNQEMTIELTGFVDFGDSTEIYENIQTKNNSSLSSVNRESVVYFNEACSMCVEYLNNDLFPITGIPELENVQLKDYINKQENRKEMTELYTSLGIPPSLQSHILTSIDDTIFLGGHVDPEIIHYLVETELPMKRIYVVQDEMDNPTFYIAWDFESEPETMDIHYPIANYIENYNQREKIDKGLWNPNSMKGFLMLVLAGGFIDGVNPCAFSVLIFFIFFLFAMKKKRGSIIATGAVFILAIFLSYLFIGLGIMQAFKLFGNNHLIALISAGLLILMGLINIKDYFWYGKGFSLSPHWLNTDFFKKNLTSLTIFSTFIAGFIVGLCTFPCTGGIYVAILGKLSTQTAFVQGLFYLILYNGAFVFPLVLILTFLTNRRTLGVITRWENSNKKIIKLVLGLLLIILGVLIYIWT